MKPAPPSQPSKLYLKVKLTDFIYAPMQKQFLENLSKIIKRNSIIWGNYQEAMWYRGELYHTVEWQPSLVPINRLHDSLVEEMEKYLADMDQVNCEEKPYIDNFLTRILNTVNSVEECKLFFPDALHPILDKFEDVFPNKDFLLDNTEIETLQQETHTSASLLKQRLVYNLIT